MRKLIIIFPLLLISFIGLKETYFLSESLIEKDNDAESKEVPDEEWFERQRAFPFSEVPNEEHLKAMEYVKTMPVTDFNGASIWSLAGPTNIEGRITSIAIHPSNAQIIYIGTANGGVWKSTNSCQSWTSVFDNQNTSSIGVVAIDPSNGNIIYCGTGEANSSRSYYPGTGMYKSTDAGTTWTNIGLINTYSFGNIAINPLNTQEIYAAATGSTRRKNIERDPRSIPWWVGALWRPSSRNSDI